MEILYARRMGFCHGVKKAFEGALAVASKSGALPSLDKSQDNKEELLEENATSIIVEDIGETDGESTKPSKPTYILGEIVHNRAVVERIESYGIRHITNPSEIKEKHARVIIRTHGATKEQIQELKRRGHEIIDLTCVVVTKVREKALKLQSRHPAVLILGKKNHPEVIGLLSWLDNGHIATDVEDVEKIPYYESVGVVCQTTFSRDKIRTLTDAIKKKFPKVEMLDTVCPHTDRNQEASLEIARVVDLMLVIGDEHSSNSKRLFEVVKMVNPNSYFVSSADDIDMEWFPREAKAERSKFKVGITAGASTPEWIIEAIARRIQRTD